MKALAIVALAFTLGVLFLAFNSGEPQPEDEFTNFISIYGKNYGTESEFQYRRKVFEENLKIAAELDKLHEETNYGMTPFSDLTADEMKLMMGARAEPPPSSEDQLPIVELNHTNAHWRTIDFSGLMQPVQNQGECGSCWAFAGTATWEARVSLHKSMHYKASEQHALDCTAYRSNCAGGWESDVWWLANQYGLCYESEYGKYTAKEGTCYACTYFPFAVEGVYICESEECMYNELLGGPMSVVVDASTWQHYTGGIMFRNSCGTQMNHAVTLIAYQFRYGSWKIRNSWGSWWGENGHARLRVLENTCNILYRPSFPHFKL